MRCSTRFSAARAWSARVRLTRAGLEATHARLGRPFGAMALFVLALALQAYFGLLLWLASRGFSLGFAPGMGGFLAVAGYFAAGWWRFQRNKRRLGFVCTECGRPFSTDRVALEELMRSGNCPSCDARIVEDPSEPNLRRRLPPMTALGEE
jgi:hypothetical protein